MTRLKNEDIICISWLVWDSIPLIMHQMMTRLARDNRILFVDPPVAYSNVAIRPSLFNNHLKKTSLWLRGVRQVREQLYVYYPPPLLLQYGHLKAVDKFNQWMTANGIQKTARRLRFKTPILWIYHPYAIHPDGRLNEKLICYDCNDDVGYFFTQVFGYKRKRLSRMEEELTKKADVVFTTSRALFELRSGQNPNTHYVPSGIDFDMFQNALSPALHVAPDIKDIPGPIIGFVGGMTNSKMNWEWIQEASQKRDNWSFVFIGPCEETLPQEIKGRENIYFMGSRKSESLPAYVKAFDVCIIPYQGEAFIKNCFPTKVFEYLAAGKPVVSSMIPALEEFQQVVRLSRNADEFISHIEMALRDGKDQGLIQDRVETARGKTWEDRVAKTTQRIVSLLNS